MKITAFPAADGDCFLLEGKSSRRMLIDGGRRGPFGRHALKRLAELREADELVDVICVSHIDADHIEGILKMLEIEVDWRVFLAHGDDGFKKPRNPRPSDFAEIWHNGFQAQLGLDADLDALPDDGGGMGDVMDLINVVAEFFTATDADSPNYHRTYSNLATSVPQALELVSRLSDAQLGKEINERFDGKLITSDKGPVDLDGLEITFIGPTRGTLEGLQKEWLRKLKDPKVQKTVKKLREKMAKDISDLASGAVDLMDVRADRLALAAELPPEFVELVASDDSGEPLGDRNGVTAPNLASIMFVAEEEGKRAVFTGDAAGQDILSGLDDANLLDHNDSIHVEVLKLQHHGAEFNIDEDFCKHVTADHYLISGDSNHGNPNHRVLEAIVNSRTPGHADFAVTGDADKPFCIDMAMSPEVASDAKRDGLQMTFDVLDDLARGLDPGRLTVTSFGQPGPVVIDLD